MIQNELCCENCFNSHTLKNFIRENGVVTNCSFCESRRIYCIDPLELRSLFWHLIHLYEPILNFMYIEEMEEGNYTDYVWDKMYEDWEVFTFGDNDLQERLIRAMYPLDERHGEYLPFLHQYVEDEVTFSP